jgi:transcriptional regulator with XRE-family HTH domain
MREGDGYRRGVDSLALEALLLYVAANIRRLRQKRSMTQEALAEATGLELRFLQKIESGRQSLSLAALLMIANALEVAPSALLRPAKMPDVKRGRPRKTRAKAKKTGL